MTQQRQENQDRGYEQCGVKDAGSSLDQTDLQQDHAESQPEWHEEIGAEEIRLGLGGRDVVHRKAEQCGPRRDSKTQYAEKRPGIPRPRPGTSVVAHIIPPATDCRYQREENERGDGRKAEQRTRTATRSEVRPAAG